MLPRDARMRRAAEFRATLRRGRRVGGRHLTVHLLARDESGDPPRVGFIVSRAVGTAVVRNRVKRRLRALLRGYLPVLPRGSLLVVRAHTAAGTARHTELAADLERALTRLVPRGGAPRRRE